jgi:hypothetical protein
MRVRLLAIFVAAFSATFAYAEPVTKFIPVPPSAVTKAQP